MAVVALELIIFFGMAIHAAWMPQHGNKCYKERAIAAFTVSRGRGRFWRPCSSEWPRKQRRREGRHDYASNHKKMHALHTASVIRIGNRRMRLPVAAKIAFAIAGAAQGTPGSPMPPDFSWLLTM